MKFERISTRSGGYSFREIAARTGHKNTLLTRS